MSWQTIVGYAVAVVVVAAMVAVGVLVVQMMWNQGIVPAIAWANKVTYLQAVHLTMMVLVFKFLSLERYDEEEEDS